MLYRSETWCLRENEISILRKTEKAMMRAMFRENIIEKRRSQELIGLLGLKDTLDGLAMASRVRWYGHVLRRDSGDVLGKALDFEVEGRRGRGRPNMTWKRQVKDIFNWYIAIQILAYQSYRNEKGKCH